MNSFQMIRETSSSRSAVTLLVLSKTEHFYNQIYTKENICQVLQSTNDIDSNYLDIGCEGRCEQQKRKCKSCLTGCTRTPWKFTGMHSYNGV